MKLIVGLGNPGEKYVNTRHNAGFLVVEKLQLDIYPDYPWKFENKFNADISMAGEAILVKPLVFMNNSGDVVGSLINFYKIPKENLFVIHDDLDIRLGEWKLQFAVGPKLHNGIASIEERIGTKDFWRLRLGVDNRTEDNRIPGEEYVLQNFSEDEMNIFSEATINAIKDLRAE
jgi:peptidyl-tRNA hydrolase, PTH1 family